MSEELKDALARIACLEGEIAKRDEELAACRVAVENCEVFRARIAELEARIVWLECEAQVNAAPVSESKAQGAGSPIRFWIIGDAGQKKGATLCKKSSRDGSLAFFETEEDATRAAKRHAGTAVYIVDYYKSAPLMMPERSNECGSDGELTYEAKAQDTVGEVVGWYRLDRPYEMTSYPSVCATWHKLGAPVAPLYAAPVQQVVPDGSTKMQWQEIVALVNEVLGCEAHKYPCERGSIGHEMTGINFNSLARIIDRVRYAAPAAPAADAGIVDMYRHLQKVTPYRFKKIQDASITDGGDVMYFHKDRFDAALLADMAAHCAAPATADSDVLECGE